MCNPSAPAGYWASTAEESRLDEIASHFTDVQRHQSGRPLVAHDDLVTFLGAPHIDLSADVILVHDAEGDLVGQEIVSSVPPHVSPDLFGVVSPDHTGAGIGTVLLDWAEQRVVRRMAAAPDGARVVLNVFCDASHQPSVDLFESAGYVANRFAIKMEIDLNEVELPPAPLPAGLELRTFRPGRDDRAAYVAMTDSFRDHYAHIDTPLEEGVARLQHSMTRPGYDPSLWWQVYDGDEIVANCWCDPEHEGDTRVGYISSLGVRRPWRGRGIARSLLSHAFRVFAARGKRGVALDVDADSLTGATHLYRSVGMRETFRAAVYEKEIRSGVDLATRSL